MSTLMCQIINKLDYYYILKSYICLKVDKSKKENTQ